MSSTFQPTRPLRGATANDDNDGVQVDNFNPRAPCGARPFEQGSISIPKIISTHAPLAGRDRLTPYRSCIAMISTHAPLAGRDDSGTLKDSEDILFQPTRPLRGATSVPD